MKNKYKRSRILFVGLAVAISLASLIFIIQNFRNNIVFFYSPSELKNEEVLQKINERQFRIGGLIKENSLKKIDASNFEFTVTDLESDIKINYHGILPDLFREGQGVVALGKLDLKKNEFFTTELLIKHDENYMPPEVAKALKERGVIRK